jgi:alkylation response protein AidB-like acyl-CoA dehydrogenase
MWGSEPFWGLGYDWDPDWMLTERHKELRATLIELCQQEMRDNAKRSDDELKFPRRNLELLGEHGFLAPTVPEEGKRALAEKLLAQAAEDEAKEPIGR